MNNCTQCGTALNDQNWFISSQAFKIKICKLCNNKNAQHNKRDSSCKYCKKKLNKSDKYVCDACNNKIKIFKRKHRRQKLNLPSYIYTPEQRKLSAKKISTINNTIEKAKCFEVYGNQCSCCQESDWRRLSIDHVKNDGALQRKQNNNLTGISFYRKIKQEGYSLDKYQLLCFNCNSAKGFYGFCPHQIKKASDICSLCNDKIHSDNVLDFYKKYNYSICTDCILNVGRKIEGSSRESRITSRNRSLKIKDDIIQNYGGQCQNCKEKEILFLCIDHKNGDGKIDRDLGLSGHRLHRFLKKSNYPKDKYQLLCFNCNAAKEISANNDNIKEYITELKEKYHTELLRLNDYKF